MFLVVQRWISCKADKSFEQITCKFCTHMIQHLGEMLPVASLIIRLSNRQRIFNLSLFFFINCANKICTP